MPSYIVVDVETRKALIACAVIGIVTFAIGIGIGFASGKGSSSTESPTATVAEAIRATCSGSSTSRTTSGKLYFDRFVQRHNEKFACVKSKYECWDLGMPRNYIAYHLNGKTITIDGKLDDDAWKEVGPKIKCILNLKFYIINQFEEHKYNYVAIIFYRSLHFQFFKDICNGNKAF